MDSKDDKKSEMMFWIKPIDPPGNNHPFMRTAAVVEVWKDGHYVGSIKPTATGIKVEGHITVEQG